MGIERKNYLKVEAICDVCGQSQGTTMLPEREYPAWVKQTTDLLTFDVGGEPKLLCWDCLKAHGHAKEYDRRVNALTYPKEKVE